jgi:citrate lyase subunit beta / citryl-CoA lyase
MPPILRLMRKSPARKRIVEAFAEAEAGGLASIQVDGRFVDYPIVQKAERILAIAAKIRAKKG